MILQFSDDIAYLEQENLWTQAIDSLYLQWVKDKNNCNKLICIGTELWFVLVSKDELNIAAELDEEDLKKRLMTITRYGFKHMYNNFLFNLFFGFMINLMPYYFIDYCGDYVGWEQKGQNMLEKAYNQNPNNLIAKVLYLGTTNRIYEFEDTRMQVSAIIDQELPNNTAVEKYFRIMTS